MDKPEYKRSTASDELIRSLLPFEQDQVRNEGYKVYEVEICMPESGCNHYETVAAKDVRDAVRIGKAYAKGMKFNGVTKVNAKELHMKKSTHERMTAAGFSHTGANAAFAKPYPLPSSITRQLNYVESSINNIKMAFEIGDADIANVSASDLVNVVSKLARMVAVAAKSYTDSGEWSRKSSGASSTPSQYAKWTDQGYTEKQAWAIAHDESRQKTT